jgi:hypothetical protein
MESGRGKGLPYMFIYRSLHLRAHSQSRGLTLFPQIVNMIVAHELGIFSARNTTTFQKVLNGVEMACNTL